MQHSQQPNFTAISNLYEGSFLKKENFKTRLKTYRDEQSNNNLVKIQRNIHAYYDICCSCGPFANVHQAMIKATTS